MVNILNRFDSEEYLFITERTLPVYYLPILSDPTSVDLDEDGFPDIYCEETKNISEYAFDDPRPLYSDVTVHHISQREYLPIKRHGEGNANYGSSQTWFREDLNYSLFSGGNVDANYASSKGCGVIAIGDILAYLELYNDKFNLMPYMNKIMQRFSSSQTTVAGYIPSIEEFRSNLGCTYDSDECRYVINSDYYLEYLRSLSYDAIIHKGKNISGVLPSNMVDIFNDAFSTNSVPYTATWCFDNSYKKLERRIDTMLDNNIPVIISYDYTVIPINDSNNYKVDPLKLYFKKEGVIKKMVDYTIKSHYMVVCEDIQFSDYVIAETEIKNSRLLKVSSWGSEYYIDFNEYCEQVNRLKGPSYTGPFIHGAGRLLRDYTCNILNIEESL